MPANTCACGKRAEGMFSCTTSFLRMRANDDTDACTCGRSENNGTSNLETDFTTKK
jgi:hypothetical protein